MLIHGGMDSIVANDCQVPLLNKDGKMAAKKRKRHKNGTKNFDILLRQGYGGQGINRMETGVIWPRKDQKDQKDAKVSGEAVYRGMAEGDGSGKEDERFD